MSAKIPLGQVNTGNQLIDDFFRELDARLAPADPRIAPKQKAMLLKTRPQLLQVALDDPEEFTREFRDAAQIIERIGKG